jgi:hypothetical protein
VGPAAAQAAAAHQQQAQKKTSQGLGLQVYPGLLQLGSPATSYTDMGSILLGGLGNFSITLGSSMFQVFGNFPRPDQCGHRWALFNCRVMHRLQPRGTTWPKNLLQRVVGV